MLRGPIGPVDPVSEPDARKTERIVSMETMGGDLNGKAVRFLIEVGNDMQIFRVAKAVGILIAETGHLPAIEILRLDGEEDEMMAKPRDDAFGFQIAGIDEQLDAVAAPEVPRPDFLKGAVDGDIKGEFIDVPAGVDVGERLFIEKIGC